MGVTFKMSPESAKNDLKKIGIPDNLLTKMTEQGVTALVKSDSIVFQKGTGVEQCKFATGILTLAKKGALKKHSLEHLQQSITLALGKLLTSEPKEDSIEPLPEGIKEAKATPSAKAATPSNVKKYMSETEIVPLSVADTMYQPVSGTGSSSRYFMIARGEDLRVAARILNGKLSIRFEGDLELYKDTFAVLGVNVASDTHASAHMDVGTLDMARRTIGSLLFGMDIAWDTENPVVAHLWNQGV